MESSGNHNFFWNCHYNNSFVENVEKVKISYCGLIRSVFGHRFD